jgi:NTP pyrophosphatase (non-canonical NTP hydrolase)
MRMSRKKHLKEVVNVTWNFSGRLKDKKDHELNAIIGLAAEAGEVLDVMKKKWFHDEKDDPEYWREKLVKELGDVDYYFIKATDILGISMSEIREMNRMKLASRHPELGEVEKRFDGNHVK